MLIKAGRTVLISQVWQKGMVLGNICLQRFEAVKCVDPEEEKNIKWNPVSYEFVPAFDTDWQLHNYSFFTCGTPRSKQQYLCWVTWCSQASSLLLCGFVGFSSSGGSNSGVSSTLFLTFPHNSLNNFSLRVQLLF